MTRPAKHVYAGMDAPRVTTEGHHRGERTQLPSQGRAGVRVALGDDGGEALPIPCSPFGAFAISTGRPFRLTGHRLEEETGLTA